MVQGKPNGDLWAGTAKECFFKEVTLPDWIGINNKVKGDRKVSTAHRGKRLCKGPEAQKSAGFLRTSSKTRRKGGSRSSH